MSEIGNIAEDIVDNDLFLTGTDRSLGVSRASGWMLNNFGKLNNVIYTCYSGENPGLKYEELAIYKNLYLATYYRGKAASVIKNMDSMTLQFLALREGDSSIQLQNKNEVAKTFRQIGLDIEAENGKLVTAYNLFQAYPRQVDVAYGILPSTGVERVIEVEAYFANGFVDIPAGQNFAVVPLSLDNSPQKLDISLIKPTDSSPNLSFSVVGTSISNTGFVVSLGGKVNQTGYKISYGVQ